MAFSKQDTLAGRPDFIKKFVKSYGKTEDDILAADATETAASAKVAHQGWTIPAGGNDNPNAMRETIIAMNIGSDIGTDDDAGLGVGGGSSATSYFLTIGPSGVSWEPGSGNYGVVTIALGYYSTSQLADDAGILPFKSSNLYNPTYPGVKSGDGLRIFTGTSMTNGSGTNDAGGNLDGSIPWGASWWWKSMNQEIFLSFYGTANGSPDQMIHQSSQGAIAGSHGELFFDWAQYWYASGAGGRTIELRY